MGSPKMWLCVNMVCLAVMCIMQAVTHGVATAFTCFACAMIGFSTCFQIERLMNGREG